MPLDDGRDWQAVKLGEVTRSFAGGTPSRSVPDYFGPGIPWLKSGEVRAGRIVRTEETITPAALKESSARVAKSGTPVIAMYGATAGVAGILGIDAALNQAVLAVEPREDVLDAEFCYRLLQSHAGRLLDLTQGSGQPNLSKALIEGLDIVLPPLGEQRRIADVLRSVDLAQAANEHASASADNALRSYLATAFERAADGDSGRPLEALLSRIIDYRGVPPPKSKSGIPLITAKNVRFGFLDPEPREYIAEEDYNAWMRRGIPTTGDVLFTTEAPLGFVAEFPAYKAALGQRTITLVADPRQIDRPYLKWLLLSEPVQDLVHRHATGSTAKGIKQSTFRKLRVNVPSLGEQQENAAICESMWRVVADTRAAAIQLLVVKEQIADDLLSGRVRVPA